MEKNEQRARKKHSHRSGGDESGFIGVLRSAGIGVLAALIAMLIMSAVASGLCLLSPDPLSLILPVGIVIFVISSAIGGAVSSVGLKKDRTAVTFSGLTCGFAIMIFLGVGALTQEALSPESTHEIGLVTAFFVRGAAIPIAALSAYASSFFEKKRRKRR